MGAFTEEFDRLLAKAVAVAVAEKAKDEDKFRKEMSLLAKEAETLRESLKTAEKRIEELECQVEAAADEAREAAEKLAEAEAAVIADRVADQARDAVRVFREAAPRLAWGEVHKKLLKVAPSHADILQTLCARLGWGVDDSPDYADIAESALAEEWNIALRKENDELREEVKRLRSVQGAAHALLVGQEMQSLIKSIEGVRADLYFLLADSGGGKPAPVYVDFKAETPITFDYLTEAPTPKPAEAPAPEPAKKPRKRKAKAEQPETPVPAEPPTAAPSPEPAASPLALPTSPKLKSFAPLPVAPAGASADGEEPPKKRTNFEELFLKLEAKASPGQQQRAALREQERKEEAFPMKPAVVAAAEAVVEVAEPVVAASDDPEGGPDQPGRLSLADLRRYIDANDGRCGALVTVVAGSAAGARRTFRFRAKTKAKLAAHERKAYFLDVLSGPDNGVDYANCGSLVQLANGGCEYRTYGEVSATTRAAATLLAGGLNTQPGWPPLPAGVEFWHQGTCARCGRSLTVPESIASGLGPECLAAVGG